MASASTSSSSHIKDFQHTTLRLTSPGSQALFVAGGITVGQQDIVLRAQSSHKFLRKPLGIDLYSLNNNYEGFRGCFTDGVWIYFVPNKLVSSSILSGTVVRMRIHEATTTNDLSNIANQEIESINVAGLGNPYLRGFQGGFSDGEYIYLFPSYNVGQSTYGYLVRVDAKTSWNVLPEVRWLNLELHDNKLKGFVGGFWDGQYIWLVPSNTGAPPLSGTVARVDPNAANWTVPGVAQVSPVSGVLSMDMRINNPDFSGFWGGFCTNTHAYFVPYFNDEFSGKIARFALSDFPDTTKIESQDISLYNNQTGTRTYVGYKYAVCDGRYAYFIPYYDGNDYHGNLVRLDLYNFGEKGAITRIQLESKNSNWKGFENAILSDRYLYLCPNQNNTSGEIVRVDLDHFTVDACVSYDASAIGAGYSGGVFVPPFVFFSPSGSGTVLRMVENG